MSYLFSWILRVLWSLPAVISCHLISHWSGGLRFLDLSLSDPSHVFLSHVFSYFSALFSDLWRSPALVHWSLMVSNFCLRSLILVRWSIKSWLTSHVPWSRTAHLIYIFIISHVPWSVIRSLNSHVFCNIPFVFWCFTNTCKVVCCCLVPCMLPAFWCFGISLFHFFFPQ